MVAGRYVQLTVSDTGVVMRRTVASVESGKTDPVPGSGTWHAQTVDGKGQKDTGTGDRGDRITVP